MELTTFLKTNNLNDFENIKNVMINTYGLCVKDDDNLYMIYYKHGQELKEENKWMRECRGIILEKGTNRIVCYTFNKNYDNISDLSGEYMVEKSIDGTQIRLFYYNGEWRYATTRCIDAKKSYWFSEKSFYQLFQDASVALNYELMNKEYCYSFVLCHQENRIVVKYDVPKLYHVLTRNMVNLEEVEQDIGVDKPEKWDIKYEDVVKLSKGEDNFSFSFEGYIIRDKENRRLKVQNEGYKMVKELRGNVNNLFYRYLEIRRDGLVDIFLKNYPEYEGRIETYQKDLVRLFNFIYQFYVSRHIKHEVDNDATPTHLKHILYILHGMYLQTGRKINYYDVAEEVNKLDTKLICHMFNKTYQPHWREEVLLEE